jgi:hypothetical protein
MTTKIYSNETHALAIYLADAFDSDTATLEWAEELIESEDYLVLTDEEADEQAADQIRESVWAFNADFIAEHCPKGINEEHITALRGDSCEDCNDALAALVEAGNGMQHFIEQAIGYDGRGHFMSHVDGEEHEVTYNGIDYFIYIIN